MVMPGDNVSLVVEFDPPVAWKKDNGLRSAKADERSEPGTVAEIVS